MARLSVYIIITYTDSTFDISRICSYRMSLSRKQIKKKAQSTFAAIMTPMISCKMIAIITNDTTVQKNPSLYPYPIRSAKTPTLASSAEESKNPDARISNLARS